MGTAELLLHPVRLRLVQALLGDEEVTTRVLAQRLDDVAPATLYRHIATLVDAGVIEVTDERRVRGAVERTLRLQTSRASVEPGDPSLSDDAAMRSGFLAYLGSLAGAFDRYLDTTGHDLAADLISFRQTSVYATDEEWHSVLRTIRDAVAPLAAQSARPGARRRLLGSVSIALDDSPAKKGDDAPPAR